MKRVTAVAMFLGVAALAAGPAPAQGRGRRWTEKPVSVESAHPYPNASREAVEVRQPGAAEIRLHFAKVEVEESFDFLEILNPRGEVVQRLTGEREDFWSAPVRGDTVRVRVVADQSLSLYGFRIDRISWRGPAVIVSPVRSLAFELPGGPSLKSGRSAPLTVRGLDRSGRPIELEGHPIYFNIYGPVEVLAVELPHRYKIVAAPDLRASTEARIVAYSGRSSAIRGECTLKVLPARPLASLIVQCRTRAVTIGKSIDLTVVGKPRDGRGGPVDLSLAEVTVDLAGPGKIVPVAGGPTARYRYEAPLAPWGPPQVVVRTRLKDDPRVRGTITLSLVRPTYPRPDAVPEARGLIRFAEYATRESSSDEWKSRRLPADGELFRNRLQNHRWVFKVDRPRVLQVEVDVYPADDPRKVTRYRESDPSLTVGPRGPEVMGEFREQFREGRGEYRVVFYVWTGPNTVEKQTIRVLRARKKP